MSDHPTNSESGNESLYDFIVVGSGAGGAPLAARLAEWGHSVLVLEAGPDLSNRPKTDPAREVTETPVFHGASSERPEISWRYFVKHYERPADPDPKWDSQEKGIFYPRATGIGGCTIHNAMITAAGPASDWDTLAREIADPSWSSRVMRYYFQQVERCEYLPRPKGLPKNLAAETYANIKWLLGYEDDPTGGHHGFDGWLTTSVVDLGLGLKDPQLIGMLAGAAKASTLAGIECPKRLLKHGLMGTGFQDLDPNHSVRQQEYPEGIALIPVAIHGPKTPEPSLRGRRSSPRDRLLSVAKTHPSNLVIWSDCLATRVLLENQGSEQWRATGIEYLRGANLYRAGLNPNSARPQAKKVFARREVILCGGSFNTPQLLMLSGIGPKKHLDEHHIECVIDSPSVGTHLQDRYEVTVISEMARPFQILDGATFREPGSNELPDPLLTQWRDRGDGLYASNGSVVGILKRSKPELPQPDLFIFGIPLKFEGYQLGYSNVDLQRLNLFTWAILKSHSQNQDGQVRLRSSDPCDLPEINFHYFRERSRPGQSDSDPDLEAVLAGVKFVREIARHAGSVVVREFFPGSNVATDDELRRWIKQVAWGHHACGTCRMGRPTDPNAVLDSSFRVLGPSSANQRRHPVKGLRVVDASIFPRIPGYFIVTNIYMASEKAAAVIHQDHSHEPVPRT